MDDKETPGGAGGTGAPPAPPSPARGFDTRRAVSIAIFATVVLAAAGVGVWFYVRGLNVESTDDAFIAADVYEVAPRIAGRLASVTVSDNEMVEAGRTIATLEPAVEQAAVDGARAALALAQAQREAARVQVGLIEAQTGAGISQSRAEVAAAGARCEQEQANLESAQADSKRARDDLYRYSGLSEQAVSAQRLAAVRSTAVSAASEVRAGEKRIASARADLAAAQSRQIAAEADVKRVDAARAQVQRWDAEVAQAQAALHAAELRLSYTRITAAAAGRITNKSAEIGDYVQEGRTLASIVPRRVWVIANFKETQLRSIRPGQKCVVHVDAYGLDLRGHVESVQAGSGAQFSLLPPQNATGNYVKVVQRVPVKIVFDEEIGPEYVLGPGMSVEPRVQIR